VKQVIKHIPSTKGFLRRGFLNLRIGHVSPKVPREPFEAHASAKLLGVSPC
jgi:hypothetical protein